MRPRACLATALWLLGALGQDSELPAVEEPSPRIIAVGDVHGSPAAFSRLLRSAKLVDESGSWIGGGTVLVQTGDLTDRGPGVREVLDLVRDLETSAQANGGRVVSLLGNHEVYNLIGYYDYQSTPAPVFAAIASSFTDGDSEKTRKKAYKEWAKWAKRYQQCAPDSSKQVWMARNPLGFVEYQEALSPRGEYGRWLRQKKVVAMVGGVVFLHGGLSPELAGMGVESLESINTRAAAELAQFDRDREWLESNAVIPRHPTLEELHCAVAYELYWMGKHFKPEAEERRRTLEEIRGRLPGLETWLLLDPRGPVWFRGYATWSDEEAETGIAKIFERFGGSRIVVGHTPQPGAVRVRAGGRIFLIDTAMAYPELRGRAVALEIRGDSISTISESGSVPLEDKLPAASPPVTGQRRAVEGASGTRSQWRGTEPGSHHLAEGLAAGHQPLGSRAPSGTDREESAAGGFLGSERVWLDAAGNPLPFADESSLLDFLITARIIDQETMGKGVTRAEKLLLEKDGVRAHAVFHDVDEEKQRYRERGKQYFNFRDSYVNNVAAYELGRLLELPNVVPTAKRKIGGKMGSIQLWIEKSIDEEERRKRGGEEGLSVHLRRRIADMWVFDNLIHNADRNQGNMLHDSRGEFWMIDHTRTFNGSRNLPDSGRIRRCSRELLEAIRDLDERTARERLDPHLRSFEIKALFARRKKLLEHLESRIADLGESSVLFSYEDADDAVTVYYEENEVPAAPVDG